MKPKLEIENDDVDCDGLLGFDESTSGFNASNNVNSSTNAAFVTNNTPQYFRWTPESTKMMLTMRFNMETHFSQRLRQKKDLWNEIASEMGRSGDYLITGEACDLKFRNMLQTFKKNRIKEERGMNDLIIWEYYTLFKEAMRNAGGHNDSDASANEQLIPSMLCESLVYNGEDTNNEIPRSCTPDKAITSTAEPKTFIKKATVCNDQSIDSPKHPKRPRLHSAHSQTDQEHFISKNLPSSDQTKSTQMDRQSAQQLPLPSETPTTTGTAIQSHEPIIIARNVSQSPHASFLTPTEFSECEIFGQSVGLQLANVRDYHYRALLKLKIQQLFFLASTEKLLEAPNLI